jgi:tRNA(fMet)-specific endonuclease VapC
MLLVDTDTVVHLFRGHRGIMSLLAAKPVEQLHVSAITVAELAYGASKSAWAAQNMSRLRELIAEWKVLSCDAAVAIRFGELKALLERSGRKIEDPDLLIAATALVHGCTLISGNRKHFGRVPEIRLETWT